MKGEKGLTDVDTDQADNGVETYVDIDTASAARLGISAKDVDNAMYDNFGQRQVANIYDELNQYHVIMGVAPQYAQSPEALNDVYVPVSSSTSSGTASTVGATSTSSSSSSSSSSASSGTPASPSNLTAARDPSTGSALSNSAKTMVPLSAIAHFAERATPSSVNHQDGVLATTVSFNLAEGYSLSQAEAQVHEAEAAIGMPTNVRGSFEGQAKQAQESNKQQPMLILAAIVVIYIVLGILYESLVHPITVLSTLPSAGVGAVLALLMFHMEFSIIALIGVFLLIGIVKKNAILIIDFALEAERSRGISATEAVREACLLRFRPILMTTLAAALGALPLAIGFGEGSELRQPLGIAIIGGLIASQLLTLLTTPVVYVYIDKLRTRKPHDRELARHPLEDEPSVSTQS
jgi:multidrug efflux pump